MTKTFRPKAWAVANVCWYALSKLESPSSTSKQIPSYIASSFARMASFILDRTAALMYPSGLVPPPTLKYFATGMLETTAED